MSVCVSHFAADCLLRELNKRGWAFEPVASDKLRDFASGSRSLGQSLSEQFGVSVNPVEILTGRNIRYDINRDVEVVRYHKGLPEGSLLRVQDDLYVSSPAFCLVQQAQRLHFVNLCQMLGWYLGVRTHKEVRDGKTVSVVEPPLITVEKLWHYLETASGLRGTQQVKQALRWTCEGAASVQETNLQLALMLPARYHGFHLKAPVMNYEVELSREERRLYDHKTCRIDLFWKGVGRGEGKGIEYQGKHHEKQLEQDISRHYALAKRGIDLLYVANEQLTSAPHMRLVAEEVARWTGKSINTRYWPSDEELQWLLDILAGSKIPRKDERWAARRS